MAADTIVKILRLKDEASPQLEVVSGSADDAAESLEGASDKAEGTGASFKELAAGGAVLVGAFVAVGAAVLKLNQHLADARNELIDTATRTGLAVDTIAGLKLAAEGSGQELSTLATGLIQFPKRMADVARGTGEALVAFESLGVSVKDANGDMRASDDVLREMASAIQAIPDPTERSAMATIAFGEAGNNLMVALGGGELDGFIDKAREFGVNVGPGAAKSADDWQRSVALMGTTFDGTLDKIATAVFGGGGMVNVLDIMSAAMAALANTVKRTLDSFRGAVDEILVAVIHAGRILSSVLNRDLDGAAAAFGDFRRRMAEGARGLARTAVTGSAAGFAAEFQRALAGIQAPAAGAGAGGAPGAAPSRGIGGARGQAASAISEADKALEALGRTTQAMLPKLDRMTKAQNQIAAIRAAMEQFGTAADPKWVAALQDAEQAMRHMQSLELKDMAKALEKMGAPLDKAAQSIDRDLVPALESLRQKMIESIFDPITKGIGAIQDPTSLLAAAGPQGAAAGAALGLIQSDPKQIQGTLTGLVDAAKNAGPTLRVILRDFIPTFIAEFPAALVTGLIDALPDIVEAFVVKLPIAIAEAIINLLKALWDSFRQLILRIIPGRQEGERRREPGVLRRAAASIGDLFRSDEGKARARQRRGFQTGGFVDRTGMFLLHQNERVIPSSGAVPQSARGMMGGGATQQIVINTNVVDPNSIDQLGRMLQRHFGSMGRSTLPIFGGA